MPCTITLEPEPQVAAWRLHLGVADYDLEDDEAAAAHTAALAAVYSDDTVLGAQFADGRIIPAEQWDAYQQELTAVRERRAERSTAPPLPTRDIRDPFTRRYMRIEETEPAWVGQPWVRRP